MSTPAKASLRAWQAEAHTYFADNARSGPTMALILFKQLMAKVSGVLGKARPAGSAMAG